MEIYCNIKDGCHSKIQVHADGTAMCGCESLDFDLETLHAGVVQNVFAVSDEDATRVVVQMKHEYFNS